MEDLVDDLPLAINLEQSEQVGEPNTGPIVEFEPNSGDRFDEVDADDSRFKLWCRTVLVLPVKEFLDRAGKQLGTVMAEDRRPRGRPASCRRFCQIWRHRCTAARPRRLQHIRSCREAR